MQREALTKNFPEAFELQNDVWYTYTDIEGYLVKFTDANNELGFGFSPHSGWKTFPQGWNTENLVEATPEKIFDVLNFVAKQMGLTDGQRVIYRDAFYTIKGELYYSLVDDLLHDENCLPIFNGREWLEKAPAATRMSKGLAEQMFNIEVVD